MHNSVNGPGLTVLERATLYGEHCKRETDVLVRARLCVLARSSLDQTKEIATAHAANAAQAARL